MLCREMTAVTRVYREMGMIMITWLPVGLDQAETFNFRHVLLGKDKYIKMKMITVFC